MSKEKLGNKAGLFDGGFGISYFFNSLKLSLKIVFHSLKKFIFKQGLKTCL